MTARKKERSMGNNNYLGVDNEHFGYNYAGVVRRYERSQNYKTLGSCAEPTEETPVIWKYRYSGGAERELKWLESADLIPDIAKNWVYYQLGADKRQHGVYNGRETVAPDLCSNMGNRVHWFPVEYLTYGLGGTPLIQPFGISN